MSTETLSYDVFVPTCGLHSGGSTTTAVPLMEDRQAGLRVARCDVDQFRTELPEFAKILSPGAGLELAHLELKARPIDA